MTEAQSSVGDVVNTPKDINPAVEVLHPGLKAALIRSKTRALISNVLASNLYANAILSAWKGLPEEVVPKYKG
jgi:hypothetical protein